MLVSLGQDRSIGGQAEEEDFVHPSPWLHCPVAEENGVPPQGVVIPVGALDGYRFGKRVAHSVVHGALAPGPLRVPLYCHV